MSKNDLMKTFERAAREVSVAEALLGEENRKLAEIDASLARCRAELAEGINHGGAPFNYDRPLVEVEADIDRLATAQGALSSRIVLLDQVRADQLSKVAAAKINLMNAETAAAEHHSACLHSDSVDRLAALVDLIAIPLSEYAEIEWRARNVDQEQRVRSGLSNQTSPPAFSIASALQDLAAGVAERLQAIGEVGEIKTAPPAALIIAKGITRDERARLLEMSRAGIDGADDFTSSKSVGAIAAERTPLTRPGWDAHNTYEAVSTSILNHLRDARGDARRRIDGAELMVEKLSIVHAELLRTDPQLHSFDEVIAACQLAREQMQITCNPPQAEPEKTEASDDSVAEAA